MGGLIMGVEKKSLSGGGVGCWWMVVGVRLVWVGYGFCELYMGFEWVINKEGWLL